VSTLISVIIHTLVLLGDSFRTKTLKVILKLHVHYRSL